MPGDLYDILVEQDGSDAGKTTYGLAWWAVSDHCDNNSDGACGGADIDALSNAIFNNSTNLDDFDMNEDGVVDLEDITDPESGWLEVGGTRNPTKTAGRAFLPGDANLDGTVDGQDFTIWNANKFTMNTDWTKGNFNGDGVVDGQDLIAWNSHKFMSSSTFPPVPEPSGMVPFFGGVVASCCCRALASKS